MRIGHDGLDVPAENGGLLMAPPCSEYAGIIRRNMEINADIRMGDETLSSLRASARQWALAAAWKYTESLGLFPGPSVDLSRPVIASGHQPALMHPGVALKAAVMARQAYELGATALFLTVDSDEFKGGAAATLSLENGRLKRIDYPLFPARGRRIFETADGEGLEIIRGRFEAMSRLMAYPRLAKPRAALADYMKKLERAALGRDDFVSHSIIMRRVWLSPEVEGFLEAPVSLLCQGREFLVFATGILARIAEFATAYNGALDEYRLARKMRYPANPFPNLERKGEFILAPFWILDGLDRTQFYVRPSAGKNPTCMRESGEEFPYSDILSGKVRLRPKAITLSLYLRLLLSDLFIHGVGGAKYDHVTDAIIKSFYLATPPEYACVSATMWLEVECADPRPRMELITKTLRDMDHHPERMGAHLPRMREMAAKKMKLVEAIIRPDADKKDLGAKIAELNGLMSGLLDPEREKLKKDLSALSAEEKEREAAQARDYPYFLYSRDSFQALADSACSQS